MGPVSSTRTPSLRGLGFGLALSLAYGAFGQGVAGAEYFWDVDPGAGSGQVLSAQDGAYGQAVEALLVESTALPGEGTHTLGIRVRDTQGNWGPTFTTIVRVDPSVSTAPDIQVSMAEYFWDADPGPGNGTAMMAVDGDYNGAIEAIMLETDDLPAMGTHVLAVRAMDVNAQWGIPFRVIVDVLPGAVSFPEVQVTAAECYLNTDPGEGSGTPLLVQDGDFSDAFEVLHGGSLPVPVLAGVNVVWTRARDANGAWGPAFGVVANIDTTITGTVGSSEWQDERTFVLAPNPVGAGQGFIVRGKDMIGTARVVIVDAEGRTIAEHRFNGRVQWFVPLEDVSAGMYTVGILMDGEKPEWRRLVVH